LNCHLRKEGKNNKINDRDKELYEQQIRIVDVQIDWLVYDLYELTEEVRVVKEK
jgi:hypothetical protein